MIESDQPDSRHTLPGLVPGIHAVIRRARVRMCAHIPVSSWSRCSKEDLTTTARRTRRSHEDETSLLCEPLRGLRAFVVKSFLAPLIATLTLVVPHAQAAPLKISTWNLNWLTARSHAEAHLPTDVHVRKAEDFAKLASYATKLAADIVAFQEVDGPAAAALVFDPARYTLITTRQSVVQRVGLAIRHDIAVVHQEDYTPLDVEPEAAFPLRHGLDATLMLPGGHLLRVLVIHLKTGCQTEGLDHPTRPQCVLLSRQIPPLAAWIAGRQAEHAAFLVMGDFNRVLDQPEPFGTALSAAAPLLRVTQGWANPCWEGAAFIDHIFAGGAARAWVQPGSLRVQVFRDSEALKSKLSDHCPVSVTINTK